MDFTFQKHQSFMLAWNEPYKYQEPIFRRVEKLICAYSLYSAFYVCKNSDAQKLKIIWIVVQDLISINLLIPIS